MFRMPEAQPLPHQQENQSEASKEQIASELEYKAYNQFLDNLDGASQETRTKIGLERSSDYRKLESSFKSAQFEFEKKYKTKSPEQVSELSTFGRFKLFLTNPSIYSDFRKFEKTKAELQAVEKNIFTFAPELVENSESYQAILKSSDASSEIAKKGRSILNRRLNQKESNSYVPLEKRVAETKQRIDVLEKTANKTSTEYEAKKNMEQEKNEVRPGIMNKGDKRGHLLSRAGSLNREKRLEEENLQNMTQAERQAEQRIANDIKTVNTIKENSGLMLNFNGRDMRDTYNEMRASRERLKNALGFDPTEGSRIKAFFSAAFTLGRDGISAYSQEIKKYDKAQKEFTRMEKALQKAVDSIKYSTDPSSKRIKDTLVEEGKIIARSKEVSSSHRDIYINVNNKAYSLSQENDLSQDVAEQRLSRATGINKQNNPSYRSPEATNLVFQFYLKIEGKRIPYGLYENDRVYSYKMLDS